MPKPIKVLLAASEATPLAQTGGLAEVIGSLPAALTSLGHPASVILPGYPEALKKGRFTELGTLEIPMGKEILKASLLKGELTRGVPVFLVKYDPYFNRPGFYGEGRTSYEDNPERFAFFSKAVLAALPHLDEPDIILANDWQTGLIMPYLIESGLKKPQGIFAIHNQGYLGLAPLTTAPVIGLPDRYYDLEGFEYYGQLSYLKAGIVYSKAVVTVSPSYAKEIQTPEGGNGLDGVLRFHAPKLHGLLNGVDCDTWNPAKDPLITANYSIDKPKNKSLCKKALLDEVGLTSDKPLFGMVTRLTAQKGLTLIVESATELFRMGLNLVILGSGEPWYEEKLQELVKLYPDNMHLRLDFDINLSHRIIAGCDFMLVPSIYEPCGLIQLYSLRYGTIPVVRAVGGLNDTVRDYMGTNPDGLWDTGFKFTQFQSGALIRAVRRAMELYSRPEDFLAMSKATMKEDFSWKNSAKAYISLFQSLTKE